MSAATEAPTQPLIVAPTQPLTHQLVLVGCDGDEDTLRKDVGAMQFILQATRALTRRAFAPLYYVNARLVLVHRIQDYLKQD